MPKKKKGRRGGHGQTMTLHAFVGPETSSRRDALPTAPAMRGDDPRRGDRGMPRGGNPWMRKSRVDAPPSRGDSSNNWRSVGRSGGGGGGSSWGRNNFDAPRRSGGVSDLEHRNRFDTQDPRGGRWRGRTQDPRFSGGDSGRDTRPAHLRNRFKKKPSTQNTTNESRESGLGGRKKETKRLTAEERAARERARAWDEQKGNLVKLKAEEKKRRQKERDAALERVPVTYSNPKSPLELAVENFEEREDITFEELSECFDRFDLKKTDAKAAASVMCKSLLDQKFSLAEYCSTIMTDLRSRKDASTLTVEVMKILHAKGNAEYLKVLGDVELSTIHEVINTGQNEQEFNALLTSQGLVFLKAVPDISGEVSEALQQGSSPTELLNIINSKVDPEQAPTNLVLVIANSIITRTFEGKEPALQLITDWSPVISRCQPNLRMQMKILFTTQKVWIKRDKKRPNLRLVFQKLHECEIVTFDALALWRDDRTKSNKKGKGQALLAVSNWITEITPPPPVEEEDEEEEDEEPLDEYLRNPNSEFF